MKRVTIDCTPMTGPDQVHDLFSQALEFPEWYGRNLDALYDMLSSCSELELTLTHTEAIDKMFRYGENLKLALDDAAKDNPLLTVVYQR